MAHSGNTCGALTGALMGIGMKYGRTRLDDLAAKEKTYEITNAFMKEFSKESLPELHGFDRAQPL
jgi:hypothetical protein